MATFPTPLVGLATPSSAAEFIPDIWSDEVIATYEKSLVLASKVRKLSMKGKKGDVIHIPKPVRGNATAKGAQAAVTIIADSNTELTVTVDQHFEYSRMIEDITGVQALSSLRRFYTDDAGYAMATNVDTSLFNLGVGLDGGPLTQDPALQASWVGSNTWIPAAVDTPLAAYTAGTGALPVFIADTLRYMLQKQDDANVPMSGRCFVICPSLVNTIRGITEFSSSDFVNFKQTSTGQIGDLYGVPIFVSTNVPTAVNTRTDRFSLLMHKDTYVLAEQVGVRSQTQYMQEYLSTLLTTDRIYGRQVYRPESGVIIATV